MIRIIIKCTCGAVLWDAHLGRVVDGGGTGKEPPILYGTADPCKACIDAAVKIVRKEP